MRTLIITKGLPASGKSTFARQLLRKESKRWKRVNKDDLRNMLDDGSYDANREEFVRQVQDSLIKQALREGYDVIVDNTHLVSTTVKKLHKLAENIGDVKVIEKAFDVPLAECIKRNALREGSARIPDNAIYRMARSAGLDRGRVLKDHEVYYPPHGSSSAPVEFDASLPWAVICDLDGTAALMNGRNPYDATHCDRDLPNEPVITSVLRDYQAGDAVLFMSGREDKYEAPTKRFLEQHFVITQHVSQRDGDRSHQMPYQLFMRVSGDKRNDAIVKRELFDAYVRGRYNIRKVYDDRDKVVRMWRDDLGLTVFQVNWGDF